MENVLYLPSKRVQVHRRPSPVKSISVDDMWDLAVAFIVNAVPPGIMPKCIPFKECSAYKAALLHLKALAI